MSTLEVSSHQMLKQMCLDLGIHILQKYEKYISVHKQPSLWCFVIAWMDGKKFPTKELFYIATNY